MSSGSVVAIVLAAGLSERMGEFKPLLTLGGVTALERCAGLFREAGIEDVRVVAGHRGAELEPLLNRLGVRTVTNPSYMEGMFSSVKAGVSTLGADEDVFFVLPVDVPLVRPATIRRLLEFHRREQGADVIYPRFRGVRGHPPLIAAGRVREISTWKGEGGLRGALGQWEAGALDLEVADRNILLDMDTIDDYRLLRERAERAGIPDRDECLALLEDVLHVNEGVIRHGEAVARVATRLGEELNRTGYSFDIPLLGGAGILHDIAKGEPDHAAAGARILCEHGFAAVAGAVATHMDIAVSEGDKVGAGELIYLADKLVRGDRPVTLEERFRAKMERHSGEPEILGNVYARLKSAQGIRNRIESSLGRPLEEVLSG